MGISWGSPYLPPMGHRINETEVRRKYRLDGIDIQDYLAAIHGNPGTRYCFDRSPRSRRCAAWTKPGFQRIMRLTVGPRTMGAAAAGP